jgi:hypothetical protein
MAHPSYQGLETATLAACGARVTCLASCASHATVQSTCNRSLWACLTDQRHSKLSAASELPFGL